MVNALLVSDLHSLPEHRILDGQNLEEKEERYSTKLFVEEKCDGAV
jgi:hypothetical protein